MRAPAIDEEELQLVYLWVDSIPLSRPKYKNISREFADGCIRLILLYHNYSENGRDNSHIPAKDGRPA